MAPAAAARERRIGAQDGTGSTSAAPGIPADSAPANILYSACAVAPKRPRRLAHAQDDLIWTDAGAPELDLAAVPNGGSGRIAPTNAPTPLRDLCAPPRRFLRAHTNVLPPRALTTSCAC